VFINTNQQFSQGITQVLFAMAVIEMAKTGQEAITYETVVSVANAGALLSTVVGTQFLEPVHAQACNQEPCPANSVDVSSLSAYLASDGPNRYVHYTVVVLVVNLVSLAIATSFLPRQRDQCHEWRIQGESTGNSRKIGYASICLSVCMVGYGIIASIMLINPHTSCYQAFGGTGCSAGEND
jgi:hypothetical protein